MSWNGLALAHYVGCNLLACPSRVVGYLTQHNQHAVDHSIVHNVTMCKVFWWRFPFMATFTSVMVDHTIHFDRSGSLLFWHLQKSLGNPQIDVLFFFFPLQMKQIKNDVKLIKNFFSKINIFYKCSNEL